jgi:hypothetical protein
MIFTLILKNERRDSLVYLRVVTVFKLLLLVRKALEIGPWTHIEISTGWAARAKACRVAALLRIIETLLKAIPEQFNMTPEGESIKPDDEDVDTEDLGWDKTEGDETSVKETDDKGA